MAVRDNQYIQHTVTTGDPLKGYLDHQWGSPPQAGMSEVTPPGLPDRVSIYAYQNRPPANRLEALANRQWFYYLDNQQYRQSRAS